ncbi:MAG: DUF1801 domain-containing protein [Erysipelothrix sp.]|jgi:hypothetical protein|nr:DUF1801 domain-containing protein [Erysipelothrix sp.]
MQKTVPLDMSIESYFETLDEKRRSDAYSLLEIFSQLTNEKAVLWRGNMIGFGTYHYRYESSHEGYAMKCGFAFRKTNITLYLYTEFDYNQPDKVDELLSKLGPHKHGKACIYIKHVKDLNLEILKQLIERNLKMVELFPSTLSC